MRRVKKTAVLLAFISIMSLGVRSFVRGDEPGAAGDPLTSKSYVDAKITELALTLAGAQQGERLAFTPVNLQPGQICVGREGTEIIMRGGKGLIYSEVPDGLVNVTSGTEVYNGEEAPLNSLLIVSRADGRGVMVTESAWFIIKGGYDVTN